VLGSSGLRWLSGDLAPWPAAGSYALLHRESFDRLPCRQRNSMVLTLVTVRFLPLASFPCRRLLGAVRQPW